MLRTSFYSPWPVCRRSPRHPLKPQRNTSTLIAEAKRVSILCGLATDPTCKFASLDDGRQLVNNPPSSPTDSDRKTTGKVRFARHPGVTRLVSDKPTWGTDRSIYKPCKGCHKVFDLAS